MEGVCRCNEFYLSVVATISEVDKSSSANQSEDDAENLLPLYIHMSNYVCARKLDTIDDV